MTVGVGWKKTEPWLDLTLSLTRHSVEWRIVVSGGVVFQVLCWIHLCFLSNPRHLYPVSPLVCVWVGRSLSPEVGHGSR